MSTPKERADARHELRRQRERELVEVVKAAQDAANATTDAELTRSPWAAPSNSPWPPSAFGCPKATDKELTTEKGQAIHQVLVSRADLGFLHPLFESAGQPADDDDRADTSLGEPPTLTSRFSGDFGPCRGHRGRCRLNDPCQLCRQPCRRRAGRYLRRAQVRSPPGSTG